MPPFSLLKSIQGTWEQSRANIQRDLEKIQFFLNKLPDTPDFISPRSTSIVTSGYPSIDTDTTDLFSIILLDVNISSFTMNLKGDPVGGQSLKIRILDNGTPRTITWGPKFVSRTGTLPTTTAASTYLYVDLIYNEITATWDCSSVSPVSLGYINVKNYPYNAVGDGVTDDSSAITAAYAALSSGGIMYFPSGSFLFTSQRDWSDSKNVVICGAGMGATKLLVSGGAMGGAPFYGAIKLSTTGSGWKSLRDFSIGRAVSPGTAIANDNGIVLGPVQNIVNIERVAVEFMGNDGILHRGNSASVNIRGCSLRQNKYGYAINGTATADAIQNLTVAENSIYNNGGGIAIVSSFGLTIRDNDIENGVDLDPILPMLNITGSNVWLSGNTLGFPSNVATATQLAIFNGQNITSVGGTFAIGANGRTAITVGANARNVTILAPQVSAPAAPGGTAFVVTAGALDTFILNPNFGNTFTTKLTDGGTRTSFWSNTTDAAVKLFQGLQWGNGNGELTTSGSIQLNVANTGLVMGASGDVWIRGHVGDSVLLQDGDGRTYIEVETGTTTAAQRIGFFGVTPVARATLSTGVGSTVDNVITALQNLGLVKQ